MNSKFKKLLLAVVDYLLAFFSLFIVLYIRYPDLLGTEFLWQHIQIFSWLFLVWLLVFYAWDLYSFTVKWNSGFLVSAFIINLGIGVTLFYAVPSMEITPKTNLVLLIIIYAVLFIGWRGLVSFFLKQMAKNRKILAIGNDEHLISLMNRIKANPKIGFTITALYGMEPGNEAISSSIYLINDKSELKAYIEKEGIETVVVSDKWYGGVMKELYALIPLGINIYHLATFHDLFLDSIPIYATSEVWFLDHLRNVNNTFYNLFKRFQDILICVVFFPVILFFGLIAALLVKFSSRGPIFYSQMRVGKDEKDFRIYKFRSMRTDAEKDGAQWSKKNDSRITPIGSFLRSTRLDELPQVINILKGDMSFVGPRPERPEFVDGLAKEIPHYHLRHLVRPGLTGWAQILFPYGDSIEDAARKLEYDLYYLKNKSILLDIKIALKTIKVVLGKMGR